MLVLLTQLPHLIPVAYCLKYRVLTQELTLAAIIIPCLQQRVDNTCIGFNEASSAYDDRHPRILTFLARTYS